MQNEKQGEKNNPTFPNHRKLSFGIHFDQRFSESNGYILSKKSLSVERTLKSFGTGGLRERNIVLLASTSTLKVYKY